MRRFLILTTAVLAGGLLTACGDDDDITGPESIAGTYILQTVNGDALPATVQGVEVSAASIQLNSNGTYTLSLTTEFFGEQTDTGTFTVDGSTVNFLDEGDVDEGDRFTGTISGDTLTIVDEGNTFVFRK